MMVDIYETRYNGHPSIDSRIDRSGDCWLWQGALSDGYGHVSVDGRGVGVHRVVYEALIAPIPDGLQIDHLCRVRHCVNPDHLEVVTAAENVKRGSVGDNNRDKTHCPQGHPYTGDNLYLNPQGKRECRECGRKQWRAWNTRRTA